MEFIQDEGYSRPELWLSDGWKFINKNKINKPMYWIDNNSLFSLNGVEKDKYEFTCFTHKFL